MLTKELHSPNKIHNQVVGVYGQNATSKTTLNHSSQLFKWGRESLEDDPRFGNPIEAFTPENIEQVEQLGLKDGRLMKKEML